MVFECIDKNMPCDVYFSSYTAGKEELFVEVAKHYGAKIWVDHGRFMDMEIIGLSKYFTLDESSTWIFLNRFAWDEEDEQKDKLYTWVY